METSIAKSLLRTVQVSGRFHASSLPRPVAAAAACQLAAAALPLQVSASRTGACSNEGSSSGGTGRTPFTSAISRRN